MTLERPEAPDPYALLPALPSFDVTSADVAHGERLSDDHAAEGAGGANVSPQLSWSGAPEGTRSYVVTCFDPDAPTPSGWWHWVVVNVSAAVTDLPRGAGASDETLPAGAYHLVNDDSVRGFNGAFPPPGDRPHRYFFVVHALDTETLDVDRDTSSAAMSLQVTFHALARGTLVATWSH